jgi:hypothetical protein
MFEGDAARGVGGGDGGDSRLETPSSSGNFVETDSSLLRVGAPAARIRNCMGKGELRDWDGGSIRLAEGALWAELFDIDTEDVPDTGLSFR